MQNDYYKIKSLNNSVDYKFINLSNFSMGYTEIIQRLSSLCPNNIHMCAAEFLKLRAKNTPRTDGRK